MRFLLVALLCALSYAQTGLLSEPHSCHWEVKWADTYCQNRILVKAGHFTVQTCAHAVVADHRCGHGALQLDHSGRCKCIPAGHGCVKHTGTADVYQKVCTHHSTHPPCRDVQPPHNWAHNTCQSQLLYTDNCAKRRSGELPDTYCAYTCGVCGGGVPTFHPTPNHHTTGPPPTSFPSVSAPTPEPSVSQPSNSPSTSYPSLSPSISSPSKTPSIKPSNLPTTSPLDVARIVFAGNYTEIIGDNNTQFLRECSDQYVDIECIDVAPGSIILQMIGPNDKLKEVKFNIASEGLWLPSYPGLVIGSTQDNSKSEDSTDLFDTLHIYLMGIGFPVLCLLVMLISYCGRDTKKHVLLEEDYMDTQEETTVSGMGSPHFDSTWEAQDYVVLVDLDK